MKIFESEKSDKWNADKDNFVDKNNVMVGYDMAQICCENAFWALTYAEHIDLTDKGNCTHFTDDVLHEYVFDVTYCKKVFNPEEEYAGHYENSISFKLIVEDSVVLPPIYLHLMNVHNGYYSHGFDCAVGGKTIYDGRI